MRENIYVLIGLAMIGVFFLVLLMILLQMKSRNKLLFQKRKIAEAEMEHQKALTHTLILSQEAERKRIGMDLHDEVGSALSALRLYIEQVFPDGDIHTVQLKKESKLKIDRIITNVRKTSHNLSPFLKGVYELSDAIEDFIANIHVVSGIAIQTNIDKTGCSFLPESAQLALYRILCELMNNTVKHAKATNITILFNKHIDKLQIIYSDNGIGFSTTGNSTRKGIGMMNIESRINLLNANFMIVSEPNAGFTMQIDIPV